MVKKKLAITIIAVILIGAIISSYFVFRSDWKFEEDRPIKVLYLMSYHRDWPWAENMINGFNDVFDDAEVEIEIREFPMDTKRNPFDEWKQQKGEEAMQVIDDWQPDIVFVTDDDAQKYVVTNYLNTETPFVFAGVNKNPEEYGYDKAKNIAGVLERVHFAGTINMLREIYPAAKKIAIFSDENPTWIGEMEYIRKEHQEQVPDIEILEWEVIRTFEGYKEKVIEYQNKADALLLLTAHTFLDENEENVLIQEVVKWNVENNKLPEMAFYEDIVEPGILFGVDVSAYEQGKAAGELAIEILLDGKKPSSLPMIPTTKGAQVINLARAKTLDLDIKSSVLINSKVFEKFPWEE